MTPQLMFYDVAPNVTAFSSTRVGGYSTGNYGAFNINEFCGDNVETIEKNKIALCSYLGITVSQLVYPHQVHDVQCRVVDHDFMNPSSKAKQSHLEGVDALITAEKNVCIGVSTADCVPIILFDSHQQVAAVVHAGWRGTVKNIVGHVLSIIREKFHVEMSGVKAVIGPSISVNAFEVGQEVFDTFSVAGFPMDEISMKKEGRWHIDLWKANQWQMLNNGINKNNIHVSGICTYDNVEKFFSARRLTINSGRILSGIMIKDEE